MNTDKNKVIQKIKTNYITQVSKFKNNPNSAMAEANGEPIAISSDNEIKFYAVPAQLYEDMLDFCEYAQRGNKELVNIPSNFSMANDDLNKITDDARKKYQDCPGGFTEC